MFRKFAILTLLLVSAAPGAQAQNLSGIDADGIREVIAKGSMPQRTTACQRLEFSGMTDPALFDVIEQKVLEALRHPPNSDAPEAPAAVAAESAAPAVNGIEDEYEKEEEAGNNPMDTTRRFISNCGKALATSGQVKYFPTLTGSRALILEFPHRRGRNFIKRDFTRAAALLPQFMVWNPIINAPRTDAAGELAHLLNMLDSNEPVLQRAGALGLIRRVGTAHPEVYDALEAQLLKRYGAVGTDEDEKAETASQYCRVLAESKNPKYLATLRNVEAASTNGKLKRYANRAISALDSSSGQSR